MNDDGTRNISPDGPNSGQSPIAAPVVVDSTGPDRDSALRAAFDRIPNELKVEYMEAMQKCPDLVASESPAEPYLSVTKNDYEATAQHIVTLWKCRKLIFGQEKAFLPMTIEGAMVDDSLYIGRGYQFDSFLRDTHGRGVWFSERRKLVEIPPDARLRCLFYQLYLIAKEPVAQEKGIVILESRIVSDNVWSGRICHIILLR